MEGTLMVTKCLVASREKKDCLLERLYDMDLQPSPALPTRSSGVNRPHFPEISRETIIELAADMDRVGFGVLAGYLERADLEDLRQFVETVVAAAGGEYVAFTGEEAVAGMLLEKLSPSSWLREFAAPSLRTRFRSCRAEPISFSDPTLLEG
jgi:hypothetical protein